MFTGMDQVPWILPITQSINNRDLLNESIYLVYELGYIYEYNIHSAYLSQVNTLYSVNIIIGMSAKLNNVYLKAEKSE